MGKFERVLLQHLSESPGDLPSGIGAMTLTRLLSRSWVTRHPYSGVGPKLYAITLAGRAALAQTAQDPADAVGA